MIQRRSGVVFTEIFDQQKMWAEQLKVMGGRQEEILTWFAQQQFQQVAFVGCGSSYGAALCAESVFQNLTWACTNTLPASEVMANPAPVFGNRRGLMVAFSRSGETTEVIWAMEKVREKIPTAQILYIGCGEGSTAQKLAHMSMMFPAAKEESPVATRSFTSMIISAFLLAGWVSRNQAFMADLGRLPERFKLKEFQDEVQRAAMAKYTQFMFLGSGPYRGLAHMGKLMVSELATTPAAASPSLELRHGMHCSIKPQMGMVFFLSDALRASETDLLREVLVHKGHPIVICEQADERVSAGAEFLFELRSGLMPWVRGLLMVPVVQLMAYYHSLAMGANPDRPKNLEPVVILKNRP